MIKVKSNLKFKKQIEQELANKKKSVLKTLITNLKAATPVDTGEARDGWMLDDKNNIVNAVEHIDRLNAGSSKQAPAHFIERTLLAQPAVKPSGTIVRSK